MIEVESVHVAGIAAVAPRNRADNLSIVDDEVFDRESIDAVINKTGIRFRRIADEQTTAADLCIRATQELLNQEVTSKERIGTVIFVTQSPDYRIPATAPWIANKIGLPKETASFDINLACSGYVYGLFVASTIAAADAGRDVLLLVGETMSRLIGKKDKGTTPLFGDAGSATVLRHDQASQNSVFDLNSDGAGNMAIYTPAGAGREPMPVTQADSQGQLSPSLMTMDGIEVFNFTLREVPKSVKRILENADNAGLRVDGIVFHQANRMITDHILKRVKRDFGWIPYSLYDFGNTSSVSIPLTIVTNIETMPREPGAFLVLTGFGAGLSWATACVSLSRTTILPLCEV